MQINMENDGHKCELCGGRSFTPIAERDGMRVYMCDGCQLAATLPQPESVEEQYDSSYFEKYRKRHAFRIARAHDRLAKIELLKGPGRLLDIGASLGYFVEAALARGWDARGVEISNAAASEARDHGLDVFSGKLEDAGYEDGSFDCVTMWDMLEHAPSPVSHMLEVNRILAPGGLVVIGTPDIGHCAFRFKKNEWRHLKPAEHLFYFAESTISRLLTKTGFSRVVPPVAGGRKFAGSMKPRIKNMSSRLVRINDVITAYGVKK